MTTSPTPVGHVIPQGWPIPDDVTEVDDSDKDKPSTHFHWVLDPTRDSEPWHCVPAALHYDGNDLSDIYGPLTVTAVREPERSEALPVNTLVELVGQLLDITGVDKAAHLAAAVQNLVTAYKTAAPADSSVLSLPTVPEGAVALIGGRTGHRYSADPDGWRHDAEGWIGDVGIILAREGSVSVVMREPRTLDVLSVDMDLNFSLLRGVSGRVWRREAVGPGWVTGGEHRCNIGDLFFTDGPLTEVFDEPGGQP